MTTLAVIVARLNSSRLKSKHLLPLPSDALGGTIKMIDHLILRLRSCNEIDKICLATTAEDHNKPLKDWARENGLHCPDFYGNPNDVVGRVDAIIDEIKPEFITFISGDCPLVDPNFLDFAMQQLKTGQFESVALADGVQSLHEGMEFYTLSGWNKIVMESKDEIEKEHVGIVNKKRSVLKTLKIPDVYDFSKISHRISVDTDADYKFMYEVYKRWFNENSEASIVDLRWVQDQILQDHSLNKINAHVVQKNPNNRYQKVNVYCHVGKEVGLGHFKRSELIARALIERLGLSACINVHRTSGLHLDSNIPTTWYESEASFERALTEDCADLILLDLNLEHLKNIPEYLVILEELKKKDKVIIGIDGLYIFEKFLDVLFIPSFYAEIKTDKVIYGWNNYLFTSRIPKQKSKLILVLTGGSDVHGFGETLPQTLNVHSTSYKIVWIQGPLASKPLIEENSNIDLIRDPGNLTELIETAEIVISTYGISFFEALYRECAVVLLCPKNIKNRYEISLLGEQKCCLFANSTQEVVSQLTRLENDQALRDKLLRANIRLFKNKTGLHRLVKLIDLKLQNIH